MVLLREFTALCIDALLLPCRVGHKNYTGTLSSGSVKIVVSIIQDATRFVSGKINDCRKVPKQEGDCASSVLAQSNGKTQMLWQMSGTSGQVYLLNYFW